MIYVYLIDAMWQEMPVLLIMMILYGIQIIFPENSDLFFFPALALMIPKYTTNISEQ